MRFAAVRLGNNAINGSRNGVNTINATSLLKRKNIGLPRPIKTKLAKCIVEAVKHMIVNN